MKFHAIWGGAAVLGFLLSGLPVWAESGLSVRSQDLADQRDEETRKPGYLPALDGGIILGRTPAVPIPVPPEKTYYDFPYQAQDFSADQRAYRAKRIHTEGSLGQIWAYDIEAAQQQPDGSWLPHKPGINWSNPKNSDYYVYGKPIYAISEGVIVNCWRNAPDNPRPYSGALDAGTPADAPLSEKKWLHADMQAEKIFGGGNFISVRHDDGTHVHYLHGKSGSVLEQLCPHNGVLLDPNDWETDSAVQNGVRVQPGQKLMETGHSGHSYAPHLHLEKTDPQNLQSLPIEFRNGLFSLLCNGRRVNDGWWPFAEKQIPAGPVLIWAPLPRGGVWSFHGETLELWGSKFAHMADSGYWPEWVDGYSVAGVPYFNTIWREAASEWIAHVLVDGETYQRLFDEALSEGFAPIFVDGVLSDGVPRYNVVFTKNASRDFVARHGLSDDEFETLFDDLTEQGYAPVNVSVVSYHNRRNHTVLFRKQQLGSWIFRPWILKRDYQSHYDDNKNSGRYPLYVNAYKHGSGVYYSVLFAERPSGPRIDRHGLSAQDYQTVFDGAGDKTVRAVSGVDGAVGRHEYIGIWRR